jgi:hypothetical protein
LYVGSAKEHTQNAMNTQRTKGEKRSEKRVRASSKWI